MKESQVSNQGNARTIKTIQHKHVQQTADNNNKYFKNKKKIKIMYA